MHRLARVIWRKPPASLTAMLGLIPAAASPPTGSVEAVSLGTVWGVAVVLWGACALVFAVLAMLRTPWTNEHINRLQTRIRRHRLGPSARRPA